MSEYDNVNEKEVIFDSFTMVSDAIKNGEIREKAPKEGVTNDKP